jgi:hypothetical protein
MQELSELHQIRALTRILTIIAEAVLQATVAYVEIRHLPDIQLLPDNTDQIPTGVQVAIPFLRGVVLKDPQVIRQDLTAVLLRADLHIVEVPNQEVLTLQVLRQVPHPAEGLLQAAVAAVLLQEGDNLKQYYSVFKVHSK